MPAIRVHLSDFNDGRTFKRKGRVLRRLVPNAVLRTDLRSTYERRDPEAQVIWRNDQGGLDLRSRAEVEGDDLEANIKEEEMVDQPAQVRPDMMYPSDYNMESVLHVAGLGGPPAPVNLRSGFEEGLIHSGSGSLSRPQVDRQPTIYRRVQSEPATLMFCTCRTDALVRNFVDEILVDTEAAKDLVAAEAAGEAPTTWLQENWMPSIEVADASMGRMMHLMGSVDEVGMGPEMLPVKARPKGLCPVCALQTELAER